jgi:isopenicillin N synthase-like dioxygenase
MFWAYFILPVPNQWPPESDVPNFKQKMDVLFEKYHALSTILNDHICDLLELPSTAISSYIPDDNITFQLGLWHHSPVTESRARDGLKEPQEHYDLDSFVTLMTQFRPGLQVKSREGKWIDVPYVPGGVVCITGTSLTYHLLADDVNSYPAQVCNSCV